MEMLRIFIISLIIRKWRRFSKHEAGRGYGEPAAADMIISFAEIASIADISKNGNPSFSYPASRVISAAAIRLAVITFPRDLHHTSHMPFI
jgi:hypothetical protein